jgi:hypothetical protein
LHQYYLKAQRHADDKAEIVQQQLHQKYQHDWKDDFGIRPTDLVPYLAEHESAPAKTANAEKRHFAWMRLKYPKRKPIPQFTPEEEVDRELKLQKKRKNSLRIFKERLGTFEINIKKSIHETRKNFIDIDQKLNALIPIALLSALVAAQTFTEKSKLMIDHRLLGLSVAILALLLKAPFPVVVLSAALSSALLYNLNN